jgi:methyl-accepting chemotaxis protein/ribose transport system substrate-binding protein
VAKAVEELGLKGKIVCFDFVEETINCIKNGTITCSIGQDPFSQGHSPIIYIYNYIAAGQKPSQGKVWTRMDIVDSSNVNNILV